MIKATYDQQKKIEELEEQCIHTLEKIGQWAEIVGRMEKESNKAQILWSTNSTWNYSQKNQQLMR